ncbi:MAG: molybdenum cofactor biosynthesis F family protein [Actinomycetia bacterium]|nr:molybdenum cofactor biosynthesis F family protein [Actinomycetes bacterium]
MSDTARWIPVGELAHAFAPDSNAPQPTGELAGRSFDLFLENGQVVRHRFETETRLSWTVLDGAGRGRTAEESYFAAKVRESIYFVDFVRHMERATTISLVLDLDARIVTALLARLPGEEECRETLAQRVRQGKELTAVSAAFSSGALDAPFTADTPRHMPTGEMVGARVAYTYSPTEQYEHIYLNEDFYTWHCLAGAEKGLADTDRCHYYNIAENLYFFVWREKIVPTLGAVMVDFDAMRTTGKIFGYAGSDFETVADFPVGARAKLLNVTR